MTVVLTALRTSSIRAADLLRRAGDAVGELADLVGDDGKALAGFARAGGLDGGVDGQDVGLLGQLRRRCRARRRSAATSCRARSMWLTIRSTWRRMPAIDCMGLVDRPVARCAPRVAVCSAICATRCCALGDLARGGEQLADRGGDLAHRRRLLLRAGGLLRGRGLQLRRRALHLADGRPDLPAQRERQEGRDDGSDDQGRQGAHDSVNVPLRAAASTSAARCSSSARSSASISPRTRRTRPCSACPRPHATASSPARNLRFAAGRSLHPSSSNLRPAAVPPSSAAVAGAGCRRSTPQIGREPLDLGRPRLVGLEEHVVAGDDEPPLAGLGVPRRAEDRGDVHETVWVWATR